ncbi:hypothetical protein LEP1GSC202_2608 [Leptospira yanagawae serovar Saopaulo str. Sao Paulo = ATCC 700523]|uniref:Lipoprotein n=1 Tax=Leptospira yanagawae serovar Saopaulo str. Sao Paulo = ATCC 700523 TaxID=1249483 RepID=A0A5E8H8V2_9LEPT|nr:hypothetical protein [Leptospira yanagawae]EOQ87148.1 hypothetical protein LEP1GSC202_2608 [Leptospira yanagawae serovar Saopaulo str. Sao Paulo = ATCC 700523]
MVFIRFIGFVFLIQLALFSNCSSPPTQITETPIVEKEKVNERNWSISPKCCTLSARFLGVVVLDQICVSETETKLKLHTTDWKRVCVLKEGMVFRDESGNQYPFLKAEGVDLCPKRTKMKDQDFYLVFTSFSPNAISFDLIEDKNAKHAHKPWVFEKVDVSNCEWK